MGLFSSKKTYVSSVVYNLAGDELERANYLKSLITGNIISNSKFSVADTIRAGYKNGPGLRLRNFYRWALDNYDEIGVPLGSISQSLKINASVVERQIAGDIFLQDVDGGIADYTEWAAQWLMTNLPNQLNTAWTADISEDANQITITLADASTRTFAPVNYDPDGLYIYATYSQKGGEVVEEMSQGDKISLGSSEAFPSTLGWDEVTNETTGKSVDLTTIVETHTTYSDGRPAEDDSSFSTTTQNYNEYIGQFEKTEYEGSNLTSGSEVISSLYQIMYQYQLGRVELQTSVDTVVQNIGGGVTRTITTTTKAEVFTLDRYYQIDEQKQIHNSLGKAQMWIYKLGSGNAELDAFLPGSGNQEEYCPYIPVRLDNKFLSESYKPEVYALAKKAYKKAGGGDFDELIAKVADNEDLKEIDYAYIMYGVSLNVLDASARKYLYLFFQKLMRSQDGNSLAYARWKSAQNEYDLAVTNWNIWQTAQSNPGSSLYGTTAPRIPVQPARPQAKVHIGNSGSLDDNLDIDIIWHSIVETKGTGLKKPGAKKNDIWFDILPVDKELKAKVRNGGVTGELKKDEISVVELCWQIEDDKWQALKLTGLAHRNHIYKKKSVIIGAQEALEDDEESGFIVPLHYETVREMSLVDSNQMCTACTFIVFNCYKVVKKKWYQTGIFKIFVFVAIIAITVATGGAAAPGLLGAAGSVGASLGLTGLMAVIAGAVINALAAMIVMQIVGQLSTMVFGDKLGAIIGTVVTLVTMQFGSNLLNGSSIASSWGNMMQAENLLKLTMAIGDGISAYVQASAAGIITKTQDLIENYEQKSEEISELFAKNIGYDMGSLDPMNLTNSVFGNPMEPPFQFITRTLLTGSDIADMSLNMLSNFSDLTVNTNLPFSAGD